MTTNKFTSNNNPMLVAASSSDGETPVYLYADPSTHGLVVSATISSVGLATSTIQTNGTQKTQIVDGSGNVIASTGNALNVAGTFSSTPPSDVTPATQNITVQDTGSTTATTNANSQSFRTGTPTVGSLALFSLSTWKTVSVQVTGAWTGTLLVEGSLDGGVTFFQKAVKQIGTSYISNNFTGNFTGTINVATLTHISVRSTAAWTGTATVTIRESVSDNGVYVHNGLTIQDSVIQTNKLTIKSASTAPIATDPSIVVTQSPNSPGATSALQTTGNTSLSTLAGAVTGSVLQDNIKQINGVVPLMGNGVTGTGSQRVTIASDNTAFAVNATLSAETTKVIGTVNQGTSPWVTTANIGTTNGLALDATLTGGNQQVQGNVADAGTDSGNPIKIGGVNKTTPTTLSSGQRGDINLDTRENMKVSLWAPNSNTAHTYGNGVSGAGVQRVVIASDNTAFSVNATLSAETTKVIGVIRTADGSGNLLTSTTNALDVNLKTSSVTLPVSLSSTTITGTVAVTESGTWNVGSSTATGSAVPANAFYDGAIAKTANPTAASDGNLVGILADKLGKQVTSPFTIRDLAADQTTSITSTTAATIIVTADASNMLDIVSMTLTNTSATGTEVSLYNDDGTTLRWTGYAPANDMRGIVFSSPFKQTAVNKAWKMITVTSIASLKVTVQFVKNI